nr:putative conserved membrane protein [Mycolicibacterium gilvum PYR-GCK]
MCQHLRMEPNGDPEARIRDLERPLADRARASELGTHPYGAPPVPPYQDVALPPMPPGVEHPAPVYGSPYYAPPQRVVHKRSNTALWLIPVVVVVVLAAGIIGIVAYFSSGTPDSYTYTPPVSGGGGPLDAPLPPQVQTRTDSTEQVITVDSGGFVSIGGVEKNQTIVCDEGTVSISGVNNTIEVTGRCGSVTVSGVDNTVTVESAGTISASGFHNRVTFLAGDPQTSTSGSGNVIERQ